MKKGKFSEFSEYLQKQVATHSMYVWGGQGQTGSKITERWIRRREQDTGGRKVNGRYYSYADLAVEFWKRQCELGYGDVMSAFDCSGLLVYWLKDMKGLIPNDMTANGLKSLCSRSREAKRGYWVFRVTDNRATHVGVLISDTEVIHAKGRVEGVVIETYSEKYWDFIGIPNCIEIDDEPAPVGKKYVRPKGTVRVREGNGTDYKQIKPTANSGDLIPLLGQAEESPFWYYVSWSGRNGYITSNSRYTEVIEQ